MKSRDFIAGKGLTLQILQQWEEEAKVSAKEWLVMAFDSTQQALRAEMLMEFMDMDVDTFPTPKQITAGCALSIRFPAAILADVTKLITTESVVIRGIFESAGEEYVCVWPEDGGIEE